MATPSGRLQVEHDALLAAVQVPVQERDAVDDRKRHLADVVAAGVLDLDDLGAEVGEMHADAAGAEERALDDADAGEEPGRRIGRGHRGGCSTPGARASHARPPPPAQPSTRPRAIVPPPSTGEQGAGDELALAAGQVDDGLGDVVGLAQPGEVHRLELGASLGGHAGVAPLVHDVADGDRVAADAPARPYSTAMDRVRALRPPLLAT